MRPEQGGASPKSKGEIQAGPCSAGGGAGSTLDIEASGQQKVFCWTPEASSGLGVR